MTRFAYVARDSAGQSINGTLTAASPTAASKQLRQEGKFLISLKPAAPGARQGPGDAPAPASPDSPRDRAPKPAGGGGKKPGPDLDAPAPTPRQRPGSSPDTVLATGRGRVNRTDVIYLTTQLAVMTDTGVPLADAMDAIKDQTTKLSMRTMLEDIASRVKGGEEFSTALARHGRVFPTMYVAMVKAAEASGTLGVMLERVAEYLIDESETRKRIKSALTYPCVMMGFALTVTVFLLTFVLPRFTAIYANRGATLPLPTRILMAVSDVFVNQWILLLIGVAGSVTGGIFFLRSQTGKAWWANAKLCLPLIGGMLHKLYLARCLRTLGTLISTGVSMLEAVQITRQIIGRGPFARLWDDVDEGLRQGQQLSDPLFRSRLIPRPIVQMITAGEKTGKLAQVMERVAMFCDRELKDRIKTSTALIEPIMISVMGLIIGTVVMALLLPIFGISKVMTQGPK